MEGTEMETTKNAVENMMLAYVNHKQIMNEIENECPEDLLLEDASYNFHRGCCETAESWMRAVGVSPECNFIIERLYK